MTGQCIDVDVQYISVCILMVSTLLNPILHSTVRRPVRRAQLLLVMWLFYVIMGCRNTLKPRAQIGMLHLICRIEGAIGSLSCKAVVSL